MTNGLRGLALGALAVASAAAAQAQAAGPDGAVRRFEVAAIKVSPPGGGTMSQIYPGGRLVANGLTLKQLIRWSYGIQGFQISGGPDWAASERYFIDAKPDGLGGDSRASAFQMLRTLLAERFHLALERSTVETAGYRLAIGRKGHKLRFVSDGDPGPNSQFNNLDGRIAAKEMPIGRFVRQLAGRVGAPVVDETGLKGNYDFVLEWTPDGAAGDSPVGPTIFTALREQLGLELQPARVNLEHFTIAHAEKPSAN